MQIEAATRALAAIAQEHRLSVFRLLMRAGPDGMAAGDIAREIGIAPNTLTFHLKEMMHAGLVRAARRGRFIRYAIEFSAVQSLLRFLSEDCCGGHPDICNLETAGAFSCASGNCGSRAMTDQPFRVLFLCTHNSARSVLAEVLLNALGRDRFVAYSAGSAPRGTVNLLAIKTLQHFGHDTSNVRSKSWDEFSGPDAPEIDFVFTLCDEAASETCPLWPGRPITDHWGMPDPSAGDVSDDEKRKAFTATYHQLHSHIAKFIQLTTTELEERSMRERVTAFSAAVRDQNAVTSGAA